MPRGGDSAGLGASPLQLGDQGGEVAGLTRLSPAALVPPQPLPAGGPPEGDRGEPSDIPAARSSGTPANPVPGRGIVGGAGPTNPPFRQLSRRFARTTLPAGRFFRTLARDRAPPRGGRLAASASAAGKRQVASGTPAAADGPVRAVRPPVGPATGGTAGGEANDEVAAPGAPEVDAAVAPPNPGGQEPLPDLGTGHGPAPDPAQSSSSEGDTSGAGEKSDVQSDALLTGGGSKPPWATCRGGSDRGFPDQGLSVVLQPLVTHKWTHQSTVSVGDIWSEVNLWRPRWTPDMAQWAVDTVIKRAETGVTQVTSVPQSVLQAVARGMVRRPSFAVPGSPLPEADRLAARTEAMELLREWAAEAQPVQHQVLFLVLQHPNDKQDFSLMVVFNAGATTGACVRLCPCCAANESFPYRYVLSYGSDTVGVRVVPTVFVLHVQIVYSIKHRTTHTKKWKPRKTQQSGGRPAKTGRSPHTSHSPTHRQTRVLPPGVSRWRVRSSR